MSKLLLTITLLSVLTFSASSQKRFTSLMDSLLNRLSQVEGIEEVDILNDLSRRYQQFHPKKSIGYAQTASKLALKLSYKQGYILAILNIGRATLSDNEWGKSSLYTHKGYALATKINYTLGKVLALENMGIEQRIRANYDKAFYYFNTALILSKRLSDQSFSGSIVSQIGLTFLKQANYPKALNCFLQSANIAEKTNNKADLLLSTNNIGALYGTIDLYNEALSYYYRALKLDNQLYNTLSAALTMNIGDAYYKKGDYSKAMRYFRKGHQLAKDTLSRSICLSNMALVLIKTQEYDKAQAYLIQANKIANALHDELGQAINYTGLSTIFYQKKKYPEAIYYATQAVTIAQKAGLGKELEEAYKALADAYAATGNYTQAYSYQSKHIALHDSIFSTENSRKIAFLQKTYELNKKQEQINLLTQTKQLQEVRIKNQTLLKYGLLGGLVVVLVFSGFLYFANRDKKHANHSLKEHNKTITQISHELKQAQQKLSVALSLGSVGTWTIDLEKQLVFTDENMACMLGLIYNPQGIPLEDFFNRVHPEDSRSEEELRMLAILDGREYEAEYRVQHPEGKTVWYFARGRAEYHENGTPITFSGVSIDITDKKDADRHKNEFLSIASHELRNPVAGVKGYLQLIERTLEKTHLSHSFALKASTQLKRLEHLTADLMDVSRIVTGELAYNFSEFNFSNTLKDLVESIQLSVSTHKLIVENAPNLTCHADKHRIEQVLTNFISNAIKYSPDGERIIIKSRCDGESIVVSVQDFGIGICKEDIGKLNERFYRVRSSAKKYEGLGLGLYIASEILKQHRGRMWVESEPEKGSVFYFSLPVEQNHNLFEPDEDDQMSA